MNYSGHKSTCMKNKNTCLQYPEIVNKIKQIEMNFDFGIIIDKSEKHLWLKIFNTYMYDTCVIDKNGNFSDNKNKQNIRFLDKFSSDEKHRIVVLEEQCMNDVLLYKPKHLWLILDDATLFTDTDISMANVITLKKPSVNIMLRNVNNQHFAYNDELMINSVDKHVKLSEIYKCAICHDTTKNTVITQCGHCFCNECILNNFKFNNNCPLCRSNINKNSLSYVDILNKNKYDYVCSIISDSDKCKILFCSSCHKNFMRHFQNKYKNVKTCENWYNDKTGCTFIDTNKLNINIISLADRIILLDNNVNMNIINLIKTKQNVSWYINTCS